MQLCVDRVVVNTRGVSGRVYLVSSLPGLRTFRTNLDGPLL